MFTCHQLGARCFVRIDGVPCDWLAAEVVNVEPLTARVLDEHPVFCGAEVTRRDAKIRVELRHWPKVEVVNYTSKAIARKGVG